MSILELGALGEFVGAIAVVGTLIYLAVQIRQNTAAVAAPTYESMVSGVTDINLMIVGNPDVASILARGNADPDSLDYEEALRYAMLLRSWANQGLKQLRLFEIGALGSRDWENLARELALGFSSPGGKRFREGIHVFEDLYAEMDKYESGDAISDWALGKEELQ